MEKIKIFCKISKDNKRMFIYSYHRKFSISNLYLIKELAEQVCAYYFQGKVRYNYSLYETFILEIKKEDKCFILNFANVWEHAINPDIPKKDLNYLKETNDNFNYWLIVRNRGAYRKFSRLWNLLQKPY